MFPTKLNDVAVRKTKPRVKPYKMADGGGIILKFYYAITGQTAAEVIHGKADHADPHVGLLTWKNAPQGRVLASDVTVAKNHLAESEINWFFRLYREHHRKSHADGHGRYSCQHGQISQLQRTQVLTHKGGVSKVQAYQKALAEYAEFNKTQKIESEIVGVRHR